MSKTDSSDLPRGATRVVECAEARAWLEQKPVLGDCSIITSMPDATEFPQWSRAQWEQWFIDTAALVMSKASPCGVTIFYQTDVKQDGVWIDKGYLIAHAAQQAGCPALWHKIVCRALPGATTFGRPAYSHLQCFSKEARLDLRQSTPDVLPSAGEVTWTRGMGAQACLVACRFVFEHTPTRTVVDPFCGHGTVLAVANAIGLDAVGVEVSRRRAQKARVLRAVVAPSGARLEWAT